MAEEQIILEFVGQSNGLKEFLDGLEQGITEEVQAIQKANKEFQTQDKSVKTLTTDVDKLGKSFNDLAKGISGGAMKQGAENLSNVTTNINKATGETTKLTTQLRALREQLGRLDEGSAEFQKLSVEAAKLEDKIGDVSQRVRTLASDTFVIDALVDTARAAAGAFSIAQGAAALFGDENEDLQKALLKVNASLAILNGLQEASAFITGQSAGKLAILNGVQKVYTFVTNGATLATRALNAALVASVGGAIIAGLAAIVVYWKDIAAWIGIAKKEQDDLNESTEDYLQKLNRGSDLVRARMNLSQRSTADLRNELQRLNEELEKIPREGLTLIVNGQKIQQDMTVARKIILDEIDKINAELEKRAQKTREKITENITELDKISGEQLPEIEVRIKPVIDEETQKKIDIFEEEIRQRQIDAEKNKQQIIKDTAIQSAEETFSAIFDITQQRRQDELNEQLNSLNKRREAELSNKELTEQQRAAINAKYAQQERELKIKAFNQEKQAKIAEALINGALAITQAIATIPKVIPGTLIPNPQFPATLALIGIATAAQVARIASTRPPAFKKGTKGAPGGMALVGEEGAELVHLPRGAKVIPHAETMKVLNGHPDTNDILSRFNIPFASPKIGALKESFAGFDYERFEKILQKNRPQSQVIFDKQGIITIVNDEGSRRTYLGQRYSAR